MIPVETLSVLEASGHSQNIYQTLWVSLTLNIASMKGFLRANCSWWALFLGVPCCIAGPLSDIWVPRQMIIKQIRIAMTGLIVGSILGGAPVTLLGLSRKGDRWTPQEIRDWSTVPPCKPNVFFPYAPKAMTSSEGKDESVEFFGHQNWHRPK